MVFHLFKWKRNIKIKTIKTYRLQSWGVDEIDKSLSFDIKMHFDRRSEVQCKQIKNQTKYHMREDKQNDSETITLCNLFHRYLKSENKTIIIENWMSAFKCRYINSNFDCNGQHWHIVESIYKEIHSLARSLTHKFDILKNMA